VTDPRLKPVKLYRGRLAGSDVRKVDWSCHACGRRLYHVCGLTRGTGRVTLTVWWQQADPSRESHCRT